MASNQKQWPPTKLVPQESVAIKTVFPMVPGTAEAAIPAAVAVAAARSHSLRVATGPNATSAATTGFSVGQGTQFGPIHPDEINKTKQKTNKKGLTAFSFSQSQSSLHMWHETNACKYIQVLLTALPCAVLFSSVWVSCEILSSNALV